MVGLDNLTLTLTLTFILTITTKPDQEIRKDPPVLSKGLVFHWPSFGVHLLVFFVLHCRKSQTQHQTLRVCVCVCLIVHASCVVCRTCVFAALAAFDEAEDEQYQHQQQDGADESYQPTLGGEAAGHHRRH